MPDARAPLDPATAVSLAPGAQLVVGSAPGTSTLVLDSGETVQLNETAAAILALCNGKRSAAEVARVSARVAARGAAVVEDAHASVMEFLAAAITLRWVIATRSISATGNNPDPLRRR